MYDELEKILGIPAFFGVVVLEFGVALIGVLGS